MLLWRRGRPAAGLLARSPLPRLTGAKPAAIFSDDIVCAFTKRDLSSRVLWRPLAAPDLFQNNHGHFPAVVAIVLRA